jgi:bacillithiol biosynthesis cysteine-adding enzyme BshC
VPTGIFEEYLSGGAGAFFDGHFAAAQDRNRAVLRAARPLVPAVADALERQNAGLTPSPARDAHLAALRRGAAAVVTGQQVGLFLGPLYTLYKAASTIRVAHALAVESGRPVVPVFWLQTEDHDLPEIAECHAPCARGTPLTLSLPASAQNRVSVAHSTLPVEVTACLQRLRSELGSLPHADAHLTRLEKHYAPGATWSAAFAALLAELFAAQGLVVVDPRDTALAGAAVPVHRRSLEAAAQIAESLSARARALESAGFAPSVHLRPGAPLSFFHPQAPDGPRYRLAPASDGFAEVGGNATHTLGELLAALDREPLRFSTSVLLRPILQDTLLPTAAYVAGPGEVSYLAQIAPLYDAYDMPMPVVVPRARLRIVEEKTMRALQRWGINADDARHPEEQLLAMISPDATDVPNRAELLRTLLTPLNEALDEARARLERSGLEANNAFDKTRATIESAVTRLAERIERAALHRDHDLVGEVGRLKMALYPNGVAQERYYGFSYFAARYGQRQFVEHVLAAIDPFDPSAKDLSCSDRDATLQTARVDA